MAGSTGHRIRNTVLLVLGLMAGSAAIRGFAPTPHIRHVSTKMTHLRGNPDGYDVLFVGSSRVFRHIMPRVFDHRLRTHGFKMRSFNFGLPGAKSVEVWHLLKDLGSSETRRPRFVFVESDGLVVRIAKENLANERETYWHQPVETSMAIRSLGGTGVGDRSRMTAFHTGAFLIDRLAIGRLRLIGSQAPHARRLRRFDTEDLGPDGDGFVPFAKAPDQTEIARREDFLDNIPKYRWMIEQQPKRSDVQGCLTEYHAAMLSNLIAAIEALGAVPVFMLSPATYPRCEVHQAHRQGLLPNLFAFDDAKEYPQLYQTRRRFDFEHLNTDGAVIYSRLLADRFSQYLGNEGRGGEE